MADDKCVAEPEIGYLIVRRKAPEQTAGGIELTGSLQDESARFFVVRSSDGYYEHGHLVKSNLQPGDEVVLAANGLKTIRMKDGSEHRQGLIRSVAFPRGMMPDDYYIVLLADVTCRVPREAVQPVLGSPKLAIVERVH